MGGGSVVNRTMGDVGKDERQSQTNATHLLTAD